MLQKFKDFIEVSNNLEKVDNKLNALHEEAKFLSRNIEDIKNSLEELQDVVNQTTKTQTKLLKKFNEDIEAIGTIRNSFKEEMFNFKLFKNQLQKELMEKFAEELEKEMEQRKEEIRIDTSKYAVVKEGIEQLSKELTASSAELAKFNEIAKRIKAEDFALVKFTAKIKEIENEKLDLMQKIDTLERLVGKLRRQR